MAIHASDVLGWTGMILLLAAYWRREHLPLRAYALLNLAGAGLVALHCYAEGAWPALGLECAWAAIAAGDLLRRRRGPGADA